jgi:hypothetical protein
LNGVKHFEVVDCDVTPIPSSCCPFKSNPSDLAVKMYPSFLPIRTLITRHVPSCLPRDPIGRCLELKGAHICTMHAIPKDCSDCSSFERGRLKRKRPLVWVIPGRINKHEIRPVCRMITVWRTCRTWRHRRSLCPAGT